MFLKSSNKENCKGYFWCLIFVFCYRRVSSQRKGAVSTFWNQTSDNLIFNSNVNIITHLLKRQHRDQRHTNTLQALTLTSSVWTSLTYWGAEAPWSLQHLIKALGHQCYRTESQSKCAELGEVKLVFVILFPSMSHLISHAHFVLHRLHLQLHL
jgi:hypothetical protein